MEPGLTLYAFQSCPYCQRVLEALRALEIEVEVKDIQQSAEHRRELVEARGRATAPVLRIEEDGDVRWLPESHAIVAYLYQRFGEGKKPPTTLASLDGYIRISMWGLLLAGAVLGEGMRDPFWLAACALGAVRAFNTARRSGSVWHIGIGGVFGLGAVSIALTMAGIADLPWWYAAYALVAVLALAALVQRIRIARRAR
jgi:glutaredoxin